MNRLLCWLLRRVYPEASWEYDNDGQIIIYTGEFLIEEVQA